MPWSRQKFERKFLAGLPSELAEMQAWVEEIAVAQGLDYYPIRYELLDVACPAIFGVACIDAGTMDW